MGLIMRHRVVHSSLGVVGHWVVCGLLVDWGVMGSDWVGDWVRDCVRDWVGDWMMNDLLGVVLNNSWVEHVMGLCGVSMHNFVMSWLVGLGMLSMDNMWSGGMSGNHLLMNMRLLSVVLDMVLSLTLLYCLVRGVVGSKSMRYLVGCVGGRVLNLVTWSVKGGNMWTFVGVMMGGLNWSLDNDLVDLWHNDFRDLNVL
jgi:hypothetical protein